MKYFKIIALFAFVLAVGVSFAAKGVENVNIPGYYDDPSSGATIVPGGVDCNETSGDPCLFGLYRVYKNQNLTGPLYKN